MLPAVQTSPATPSPSPAASGLPSGQSLNNMFLQLLVAQLQNQSPLNPMDPSQFVGQLAQFSELSEVTSIYQLLQQLSPATPAVTPASAANAPHAAAPVSVAHSSPAAPQFAFAPADGFSQMVQQALTRVQGGH